MPLDLSCFYQLYHQKWENRVLYTQRLFKSGPDQLAETDTASWKGQLATECHRL